MIKDRLLDIGPFISAKPDFASVRFLQLHSREFNNLLFLYRRSQYCTTTLGDCNVCSRIKERMSCCPKQSNINMQQLTFQDDNENVQKQISRGHVTEGANPWIIWIIVSGGF